MAAETYIPYGRQSVEQDDIDAVVEVLRSDWLTTGPAVSCFENALAEKVGTAHAVAVSSGTAALHAAVFAAGIGPGDEVIVSPLSFVATANAVLYQGGTAVFADVEEGTLLLDPQAVAARISPRTKAIIAVDYAGQPCDYLALKTLAKEHQLTLIADACHSLGGRYQGQPVGSHADLSVFSFHPVKPITSAEGGMVVTDNAEFAKRMRCFRNHGIAQDHHQRKLENSWHYDMQELGCNYRLSDLQCALGLSQLGKLDGWVKKRRQLAAEYKRQLANITEVTALQQRSESESGWHLYVIKVAAEDREGLFRQLRDKGIGVNVHYQPIYLHSYYQQLGYLEGLCPVGENCYAQILSLPLYPAMEFADVQLVCEQIAAFYSGRGGA